MLTDEKKSIIVRYIKAYLSVFSVIAVVVGISEAKGAGWRPALVGVPMYAILFILVTYQLIKDIQAMKRKDTKK